MTKASDAQPSRQTQMRHRGPSTNARLVPGPRRARPGRWGRIPIARPGLEDVLHCVLVESQQMPQLSVGWVVLAVLRVVTEFLRVQKAALRYLPERFAALAKTSNTPSAKIQKFRLREPFKAARP